MTITWATLDGFVAQVIILGSHLDRFRAESGPGGGEIFTPGHADVPEKPLQGHHPWPGVRKRLSPGPHLMDLWLR